MLQQVIKYLPISPLAQYTQLEAENVNILLPH
jgi:hypothetical protein